MDMSINCGGARCKARRCRKCHATRRKMRAWYVSAKRLEEWESMSAEERRELVVANKDKGAGKGVKREVTLLEKSKCEDSLELKASKPFMTKKQLLCSACDYKFS